MALLPAHGHFRTVYNRAPNSLTSLNAPIQIELYEWLRIGTLTSSSNVAPLTSDFALGKLARSLQYGLGSHSAACVFL